MKHLLKMLDLSSKEIEEILNLSDQRKYEHKHGIERRVMEGRTLGMIFQKPSTRTRVACEVGFYQLGGHSIYLPAESLQMCRGEANEDTARTLSRFIDILMIRTYDQAQVEELARYGTIPVINGMTDFAHPVQALAHLMTIRELKGRLDGLKVAFIGDGASAMNSAIIGCLKCRMNVAVACPEGYDPDAMALDYAAQVGHFEMYRDPRGAARAADVVITDSWIPIGKELDYNRRCTAFQNFTVSGEVMNYAKPDAIVLHTLPAQRGEEITGEVFEQHSNEIFEATENHIHVQKALMCHLMGLD